MTDRVMKKKKDKKSKRRVTAERDVTESDTGDSSGAVAVKDQSRHYPSSEL